MGGDGARTAPGTAPGSAPGSAPGPASLGDLTWREAADAAPVLVVPLGSCEQHGPHLPLDTDTRIATALAAGLIGAVARLDGAPLLLTPPLAIAASGEHAGFAGTLSIGTTVLTQVLVEVVRSADWARGVVMVNGHGGNLEALRSVVAQARAEGRWVHAWSPSIDGGDAHAGRTETSLLLAIDPSAVRAELAAAGPVAPLRELMPMLRAGGVRAVSHTGVLGDPAGASADEGRRLLHVLTADLVEDVRRWWARRPPDPGSGPEADG